MLQILARPAQLEFKPPDPFLLVLVAPQFSIKLHSEVEGKVAGFWLGSQTFLRAHCKHRRHFTDYLLTACAGRGRLKLVQLRDQSEQIARLQPRISLLFRPIRRPLKDGCSSCRFEPCDP